ncbi:MAG: hypothetical protein LBB68_00025 [Treponema sp.]|nr:hypothetical protein [Treponema sp.]
MITGYGCSAALDEGWKHKHSGSARVVLQGFGCVGASMAWNLNQLGYKVVGIYSQFGPGIGGSDSPRF